MERACAGIPPAVRPRWLLVSAGVAGLVVAALVVSVPPAPAATGCGSLGCAPEVTNEAARVERFLDGKIGSLRFQLMTFANSRGAKALKAGAERQTAHTLASGVIAQLTRCGGILSGDGSTCTAGPAGTYEVSELYQLAPPPAANAQPQFLTIWGGSVASTPAGVPVPLWSPASATEVAGEDVYTMSFDFDNLHAIYPALATTGSLSATIDERLDPTKPAPGVKTVTTVTFTNLLPTPMRPPGPRNGTYERTDYPGLGGIDTLDESVVLRSPPNPAGELADTNVVQRWYAANDGLTHYRSDAEAVGYVLSPGSKVIESSCTIPTAPTPLTYQMRKLEDASGNTVSGSSHQTGAGGACDPALGPPVSLTDNASDYNFSSSTTIPGAW